MLSFVGVAGLQRNALHRCWRLRHSATRMSQERSFWYTRGIEDDKTHPHRPTCGILVIGDEILNGSTVDTNSHYLCKKLHKRGAVVKKISIVGDFVDEISREIRLFSDSFDVVITTGGIGPTHDDRTFEGLGLAFNDPLEINHEMFKVVEVFLRKTKLQDVDAAVVKFCNIPRTASLLWGAAEPPQSVSEMTRFPSVRLKNVICLPGVPKFCRLAYEQLEETIFPQSATSAFFNKKIFLRRNEVNLQEKLTEIAEEFKNTAASIGSYPVMDNSYFKTKLVVESSNQEDGQKAYDRLIQAFSEYVVNYDEKAWISSHKKLDNYISNLQGHEFEQRLKSAVQVIDRILDEYRKYGPGRPIQAFHILCDDEFSEMADFIRDAGRKYNLDTQELNGPMKTGLQQLQERKNDIVAVFMGSRKADPNGKFMNTECEWTDKEWPRYLRVCPILHWHYSDVWRVLRSLCIPYCPLYDKGYTSLGDRRLTMKNSALKTEDGRYRPAYELSEDHLERRGRLETAETSKI